VSLDLDVDLHLQKVITSILYKKLSYRWQTARRV